MENRGRKSNLKRNLAIGATGLAITAGAVAVGAALANKKTRKVITEGAGRGMEALKKATEGIGNRYQATTHQVSKRGHKSPKVRKNAK